MADDSANRPPIPADRFISTQQCRWGILGSVGWSAKRIVLGAALGLAVLACLYVCVVLWLNWRSPPFDLFVLDHVDAPRHDGSILWPLAATAAALGVTVATAAVLRRWWQRSR